MSYRCISAH